VIGGAPGPGSEVVVAADHMQRCKYHIIPLKPDVFHKVRVTRYMSLADYLDLLPTRGEVGIREKSLANKSKPFQREIGPVVLAVGSGPLVVARCVDKGSVEFLIKIEAMLNQFIGAQLASGLDITGMHHELNGWISIDLIDQIQKFRLIARAIRHVADES